MRILLFENYTQLSDNHLFHGSSERGGESILKDGYIRASAGGSGMMSPRPNMVYLSSTLAYSMHYTLGGEYKSMIKSVQTGTRESNPWIEESGRFGYMFFVNRIILQGRQLLPDEDGLGMLVAAALGFDEGSISEHMPNYQGMDDDVQDALVSAYEYIDKDGFDDTNTYYDEDLGEYVEENGMHLTDALKDGDMAAFAYTGKEIVSRLDRDTMDTIINDYGSHLSVSGNVPFESAYRFDKAMLNQLRPDLSNFLDLAELVK